MIYIADENDEGKRLDICLAEVLQDFSRSKIQTLIKSDKILVNHESKKNSYQLKEDDVVEIDTSITAPLILKEQNIPIDIIYDDENLAVVNKPSGMLTHPTTLETENTLVNALLYRFGKNLSDINGEFRRGIVHRLDRNTSGLLIIAKNNTAHKLIAEEIKNHNIEKKYRAVLTGVLNIDEQTINLPIARNPKQPHKMMVAESGGKDSTTIINVTKRYKNATAVELTLITGRTHQIRVHTSYIKHPVYNDTLYGAPKGKVYTMEQVLQSFYLRFTNPFSGEIITLEIPPDEKYMKVINYLESREK